MRGVSIGWKGGSTRRWRALRAAVLLRNEQENKGACQLAYPGTWTVRVRGEDGAWRYETRRCEGVASHVHHKLGKSVTGDDPRYLMAVCPSCNRRAGEPQSQPDPPVRGVTTW